MIGKPYSDRAVRHAQTFLARCLKDGAAPGLPPPGLALSDAFVGRWGVGQQTQAR